MGVHQERILFIINNCVKEPLSIHTLNESETVLAFLIQISDYKDAWIREIGQVRLLSKLGTLNKIKYPGCLFFRK